MRVVTDGDDGLRNFVQRSSPRPMESQLDWSHIGMKLELLRKAVVMPVTYREYLEDPHAFDPLQRRVSRLRNALWRGKSWQALLQFAWLRGDIDRWAAEHRGHCADSVRRARQVIKEIRYYVYGNRRSLRDFTKQRAEGHRISTAHVESVMNHLFNHRLSKKQQMRRSPERSPLSPASSRGAFKRHADRCLSGGESKFSWLVWIFACGALMAGTPTYVPLPALTVTPVPATDSARPRKIASWAVFVIP
jgi:hypothetical protein